MLQSALIEPLALNLANSLGIDNELSKAFDKVKISLNFISEVLTDKSVFG